MRLEDMDILDEGVLDITPEAADQLRAEYEAEQAAKAARKAYEREQVNAAVRIAQRRQAEMYAEELARDVAWARTVLVAGETFLSGDTLYAALYLTKKASLARTLSFSETARLRRAAFALAPEFVLTGAVA